MRYHMPYLLLLCLFATFGLTATARAGIQTNNVDYTVDGQTFEGYYARNSGLGAHQPLVVIVPDWDGLNAYEKRRARMLAESGYGAFAIDLYGKGVHPGTAAEMKKLSGALYANRQTMRQRLRGALRAARQLTGVDPARIVVIGYCFGGAATLELARAGARVKGFVVFHGNLNTPAGEDYSHVRAPVLILHGSRDAASPMAVVARLAQELDRANVHYTMKIYSGTPHAFTVWSGDRYMGWADLDSWAELEAFLQRHLR